MKKYKVLICLLVSAALWQACADDESEQPKPQPAVYDATAYELNYYGLPAPNLPADNQLTKQSVQLGKMLFYEPMLSRNGVQTCATCHSQPSSFSDTAKFSIGVEGLPGKRQSMAIFNMAWHTNQFFWDGRADLLRDQVLMPIQDPLEMNETLENVVAKLSGTQLYRDQFMRAFGTEDVNPERISLALEQFILTIISANSKYDKYKAGLAELSESELRGLELFEAEYNPFFPEFSGADCQHCHGGPNFENDLYMNNGLDIEADFLDFGRENATENPADRAKFKVPSLRNIAVTPPYMHDGRFATLEEVVDHYNEGIHPSPTIDQALLATAETGLFLTTEDKTDLINFLKTLTDETYLENPEYASPF
ncbi:cytochrome-c peroxidase [Cryomorpha ignava]|uniref:Cytochrome-c peroxidase n=1 Tax=Cryomorpha ignava TaxID=101383 RepID=A0A7K3WQV1_9FLAO|nr:cytochrome c peroxidase [Cryomorpha ignava]NEN23834.1 cytochrome-c peroxidase [Cryomorpha ignava]